MIKASRDKVMEEKLHASESVIQMEPYETIKLLESHLRQNNIAQESRSWSIEYSPLEGRGMFATRDIQAGELIFTDVPLLIGPRCYSKYLSMCVVCYKNNCPLFPCDHGCGLPICSTECENSMMHSQAECQLLREWMPTCGSTWSKELLLAVTLIRGLTLSKEQRKLLYAFECHSNLTRNYEVYLIRFTFPSYMIFNKFLICIAFIDLTEMHAKNEQLNYYQTTCISKSRIRGHSKDILSS